MSRYRKVEVKTWADAKFRQLSPMPPSGQGLWMFLMTGPHTGPIPGLFRAGRAGMAEELGWEVEAFDKAFEEVSQQGMAKADFKARLVWLPKAIEHNKPESPNVVRSWRVEIDLLPECDLKNEALACIREFLAHAGDPFLAAFDEILKPPRRASRKPAAKPSAKPSPKPSPKTMANQEQEQEQQQEENLPAAPAASGDATGAKRPRRPKRAGKPEDEKADEGIGTPVWKRYAAAYHQRYGVEPVRNAKANALCAQLVKRLGEVAPDVAAFYLGHSKPLYQHARHALDLLVRDAEGLHTDMQLGFTTDPDPDQPAWVQERDRREAGISAVLSGVKGLKRGSDLMEDFENDDRTIDAGIREVPSSTLGFG